VMAVMKRVAKRESRNASRVLTFASDKIRKHRVPRTGGSYGILFEFETKRERNADAACATRDGSLDRGTPKRGDLTERLPRRGIRRNARRAGV